MLNQKFSMTVVRVGKFCCQILTNAELIQPWEASRLGEIQPHTWTQTTLCMACLPTELHSHPECCSDIPLNDQILPTKTAQACPRSSLNESHVMQMHRLTLCVGSHTNELKDSSQSSWSYSRCCFRRCRFCCCWFWPSCNDYMADF